jgi:hypothetical protein
VEKVYKQIRRIKVTGQFYVTGGFNLRLNLWKIKRLYEENKYLERNPARYYL